MAEAQGVQTLDETTAGSAAQRSTGKQADALWWANSLSASTAQGLDRSAIPLPPQIRQEQQRHEAARVAAEKADALRRDLARRDEERRRATQVSRSVAVTCGRCGTICNEAPTTSFSFCTVCGADLPTGHGASISEVGTMSRSMPAAPLYQASQVGAGMVAQTRTTVTQAAPRATITPGAAGLTAFLIPGVGQLLNGQPEKGILLLLGLYIATFLLHLTPFGLALLAARTVVAIDAYRIAERRRRGQSVRSGEWDIS
jgi:hypothetical protein